jgi:O-antigen/teichoic acid export membrane protein
VELTPNYRILLRSASWNYLGYFFEAAVSFFLVAYIVRRVGVVDYGVYVFALSLAGQLGLADLGLPSLLIRAYLDERSRGGVSGVSRLLSTSFVFSALLGVVAFALCVGIAALLPGPFRIPPELVPLGRRVVALAGAWIFLAMASKPLELGLESWRRYDTLNKIQISLATLRALATLLALSQGYGVLGLIWIQVGLPAVRITLLWALLPGQTGGVRANPFLWDWPLLRRVLRSVGWASLDQAVWQLGIGMDLLIVSVLVSMRGVAIYSVGSKLASGFTALVGRGLKVTFPALAEHHVGGDSEGLRRLFLATCRLASAVLFPVMLTLIVFAGAFVQAWAGPQYLGAATVMRCLLAGWLFEGVMFASYLLLYACNRISTVARVALGENALNFGLSCLLVVPFGVAGPAIATAVTHTLGALGWFAVKACRTAGLAPRRLASLLIKDNAVPGLLWLVGITLVWYVSRGMAAWARLLIGLPAGPLFYLGALLATKRAVPAMLGMRASEGARRPGRGECAR